MKITKILAAEASLSAKTLWKRLLPKNARLKSETFCWMMAVIFMWSTRLLKP